MTTRISLILAISFHTASIQLGPKEFYLVQAKGRRMGLTVSEQLSLDKAWVKATFEELKQKIGLWPKLDETVALNFFGAHRDNIRACMSFIEAHIWPNGIPFPVDPDIVQLPENVGASVCFDPITQRFRLQLPKKFVKYPAYNLAALAHEYAHVYHHLHAPELIIESLGSHVHNLTYECKTDLTTVLFGMGDIYKNCRVVPLTNRFIKAGYISDELLDEGRKLYNNIKVSNRDGSKVPVTMNTSRPSTYTPPAPTGILSRKPGFHRPAIPSPVPQPRGDRIRAKASPVITNRLESSPPPIKHSRNVKPSPKIQPKNRKGDHT